MTPRRALLAFALGALVGGAAAPPALAAEPLQMTNLQVEGGEREWHASNLFRLDWNQVPGPPRYPRAVVYRLFDSAGRLVAGPVRNTRVVMTIDPLEVPARPDAYLVEAWLENAAGEAGPPAFATLRFDDVVPAPPAPAAPAKWLTTRETVRLRIGHPAGPRPLAGVRGYAISLDQGAKSSPCAHPSWCSVAETDLAGGVDDDEIVLGPLPEGTTFARVAAVSGSGVASALASVPLRVDGSPPRLSLHGLPEGWSRGAVRLTVLAADSLSGMAAAGPTGPLTAIAVDDAAPALASGERVSTWTSGSGVHRVSYFARDAAGNVGVLGPEPAMATVAIDEEAPRVSFVAAQDPAEPERLEALVADAHSGPSRNRGGIWLRKASTDVPFEELPTRVVDNRLVARWASDSYPPGKYEFLAEGYDQAGNRATGSDRVRGARMVLVNPLKSPVFLQAGFAGRASNIVRFGHHVRFGGRLRSSAGRAVGGLPVTVTETFSAGSEPRQRTTLVRTEEDGTFALALAPGPSRDVAASFAGTRTLTSAAAEKVHLGVLAAVRLHASVATARVGGAPVVFSGSVVRAGAAASRSGLPVELEFRYRGAGWRGFRTVETDARRRFRYAYRFSDDDSRGVRFRFRAYVKGREGWPYEPAYSRPIAVLGR